MYKEFKHLEKSLRILKKCTSSILSRYEKSDEKDNFTVIKRGKGPYLYDYDGNRYVDFSLDRGSLTIGHAQPKVTSLLKSWLSRGYGADPVTASHIASHEILSKLLWGTLWEGEGKPDIEEWIFIYSGSPLEACANVISLLGKAGCGKVAYASTGPGSRTASRLSRIFLGMESASPSSADAGPADLVILRPPLGDTKDTGPKDEAKGERGIVLISDETELLLHASVRRRPELMSRLDGRIIGSWAAGGLPFGCAVVKTSLFDRLRTFDEILPLAGSLPLYMVKAAARSIDVFEQSGGFAGILQKHREFFASLGGGFFELREGLLFMREGGALLRRYRDLRGQLLRKGILFPLSPSDPLSLSYSHDGELLDKCARQIDLLFDIFYR